MNQVNTIDLKGLSHTEKEERIFPNVEKLAEGDNLRLVMEFNPIPLVYLLNARNEFEITREKEGPDEWILNIKRVSSTDSLRDELKAMLTELREGELTDASKEKAKTLFKTVDATTLGMLEQELIREGVSYSEIRESLCDIHLEVLKDSLVAKRIDVSAPHPVHTLMEEHKIIVDSLKELRSITELIKGQKAFDELGENLERLKGIAHHLVEAENHHQREEDALFPQLEKRDITEPVKIMKLDHEEFRKRKKELFQVTHNHQDYTFVDFKQKVIELGEYICKELDSHIFKEDNILYQIALQELTLAEWDEVKHECDKIGYCCFSPEDQQKEGEVAHKH